MTTKGATSAQFLAKPDPLLIEPAMYHSADLDHDGAINLVELIRLIELYNMRRLGSRTGCYSTATGTVDGFAGDLTRDPASGVSLAAYHSADINRDEQISLGELTRVLELYNVRTGPVRVGRYRRQFGSENGFVPAAP